MGAIEDSIILCWADSFEDEGRIWASVRVRSREDNQLVAIHSLFVQLLRRCAGLTHNLEPKARAVEALARELQDGTNESSERPATNAAIHAARADSWGAWSDSLGDMWSGIQSATYLMINPKTEFKGKSPSV